MTHVCVSKLGHHWFWKWLGAWSEPNNYLNQCWHIVNWTPTNKLQWNCNRNSYVFIQENAFKNVICEMAANCLGLNMLTQDWRNSVADALELLQSCAKPSICSFSWILLLGNMTNYAYISVQTGVMDHILYHHKWKKVLVVFPQNKFMTLWIFV